jgi:hypothetical protein
MQQFIPFNDQWDELAALVPYHAQEGSLGPLPASVKPAATALCGSRYNEEDLFAGWPETR